MKRGKRPFAETQTASARFCRQTCPSTQTFQVDDTHAPLPCDDHPFRAQFRERAAHGFGGRPQHLRQLLARLVKDELVTLSRALRARPARQQVSSHALDDGASGDALHVFFGLTQFDREALRNRTLHRRVSAEELLEIAEFQKAYLSLIHDYGRAGVRRFGKERPISQHVRRIDNADDLAPSEAAILYQFNAAAAYEIKTERTIALVEDAVAGMVAMRDRKPLEALPIRGSDLLKQGKASQPTETGPCA